MLSDIRTLFVRRWGEQQLVCSLKRVKGFEYPKGMAALFRQSLQGPSTLKPKPSRPPGAPDSRACRVNVGFTTPTRILLDGSRRVRFILSLGACLQDGEAPSCPWLRFPLTGNRILSRPECGDQRNDNSESAVEAQDPHAGLLWPGAAPEPSRHQVIHVRRGDHRESRPGGKVGHPYAAVAQLRWAIDG